MEKELVEEYLRSRGSLDYAEIREILTKYNLPYRSAPYRFADFFEPDSLARLFFIGRSMPRTIHDILIKYVKPLEIKYTVFEESELKMNLEKIEIRESFERDCINYIKLVNSLRETL